MAQAHLPPCAPHLATIELLLQRLPERLAACGPAAVKLIRSCDMKAKTCLLHSNVHQPVILCDLIQGLPYGSARACLTRTADARGQILSLPL